MLNLKSPIGTNYRVDPNDRMDTKRALSDLGYYDVPAHRGIDDWTDGATFDGIKRFQQDNSLKVDGFMRPGGPTEQTMNVQLAANEVPEQKANTQAASKGTGGAIGDFVRNYNDMRDANTIGADKYFHCKANCEATQRGGLGEATATGMSNLREWLDMNVKGDPKWASDQDQEANRFGREAAKKWPGQSCGTSCGPYRPKGLPPRY